MSRLESLSGALTNRPGRPREVIRVALEQIEVRPQVRKHFDEEAILGLMETIRRDGQLQPLLIQPHPEDTDRFVLIAGERRLTALRRLGEDAALARVVHPQSAAEAKRLQLLENMAREPLNALEQVESLLELLEAELQLSRPEVMVRIQRAYNAAQGVTQAEIEALQNFFRSFGTSLASFYSRQLGLLKLPEAVQERLRRGEVSVGEALRSRHAPAGEAGENAPSGDQDASPGTKPSTASRRKSPMSNPAAQVLLRRLRSLSSQVASRELSPQQESEINRLLTQIEEHLN